MKIKGAFPVRWAAQNGNDGIGVTIVKTEVKYAVSTNTTRPSSGWVANIPTNIADGNYLWTWTHVEYSDGTQTNAYSVARQGIDGKGIKSSVVTYSLQATNVNPESINNWGAFPSTLTDGYWLYTRTVITYSEGDTTTSYSVSQVGVGSYYAGCEERYAAGDSATTPPQGAITAGTYSAGTLPNTTWTQERPTLNTSTPYLWNFEISHDSRGNSYVTDARCIGNFTKGIVSIVEAYAISSQGTVPNGRSYPSDIANNDWQDEAHAVVPTDTKRYQWNRTTVTYNQGDPDVFYHVSAVKGLDGKGTVYIDLDNESDIIMYDGSGNRIGGDSISNIKLYENGQNITSGKTFSIDSKSNTVSAVVEGTVLKVSGITSDDGYVIVKCNYGGVSYYARYTVKRYVGRDKYEIECSPSAITLNTTTGTNSGATVTVKVYKTAQNGTRSLLTRLPTNYKLKRFYNDTQSVDMTSTFNSNNNGSVNFDVVTSWKRYRVELRDDSNNILDYETIPISKVENGGKGDSGAAVIVAITDSRSFTTDLWNTYGANGHSENWNRIQNYADYRVGDTIVILGTDTDKNVSVQLFAKVTSIGSPTTTNGVQSATVTATSYSMIVGGAMADYYELAPSLDVVSFAKSADGKSLTPSSRTLTVKCNHVTTTGRTLVDKPSGYSIRYSYTEVANPTTSITEFPSGGLSIASNTNNTMVYLYLFKSSTLVDRATVPIQKSGVDGADNIGVSINLNNDMSSFPMTYAGRSSGQTTHTNNVSLYVGNTPQNITELNIVLSDTDTTKVAVTSRPKNGDYFTGAFTITVKSAKSFTADKITATITVKSADVPDGKVIVFTLQGVRAGKEGTNAVLYELVPSHGTVSFGRDSSDNLTPSSVTVTCGYQKNDGGTITNYSGDNTANLWVDGGAPYNMMYRFQESDGTWSEWSLSKDLPNGAVVIRTNSTRLALEYILTSAGRIADVSDSNIIDRETIPIVRAGKKGGTGDPGDDATSYWMITSVDEIMRYQTGALSNETFTVEAKKKVGDATPCAASDVSLTYKYKELGVVSTERPVPPNKTITVGLWWSEITIFSKVGTAEVSRKTILVKDAAASTGANLVNGTNFSDDRDDNTTYADGNVVTCFDGIKGLFNAGFKSTVANYQDFFITGIHHSTDKRLLPSSWYTLSFWAKAEKYLQLNENLTKAAYGFAQEKVWFTKGAHKIEINGRISSAALSAGKELRTFIYQDGWGWSASVATSSTSNTTMTLNFNIPSDGYYNINSYVYKSGESTITNTSWTATVNWYRIYNPFVKSYIHPSNNVGTDSCIDTDYVQVVDGVSNVKGKPSDGWANYLLSTEWTHHTFTFRTKSEVPIEDDVRQWLRFRHEVGMNTVTICGIKLEKGIFATDWGRSEKDKGGLDGLIMRVTEWAAGVEYHNDEDLDAAPRFLDIVVTGSGTGSAKRFMCKKGKTHVSEASNANGKGQPTGTNTYWTELNNSFPIYTPLLLADNAIIRFTQTNQILVEDNGSVIAGMAGRSNFPLFVGANQNNPSAAPFRVTKAGKLYAIGAEITGGFTGFLRREPLVLTNSNFRNYCYADNDRPYIPFDNAPLINFTLTGRYIVFSGITTTVDVFLPSFDARADVWHEHAPEARKYVGQTILIESKNNSSTRIEGLIGTSLENATFGSIYLGNNEFCELECVHDVVATNKEIVYWKYVQGKICL